MVEKTIRIKRILTSMKQDIIKIGSFENKITGNDIENLEKLLNDKLVLLKYERMLELEKESLTVITNIDLREISNLESKKVVKDYIKKGFKL